MISFDEASTRLLALAQPLGHETIPFEQVAGRRLAAPVTARFSMPRTDVSMMDGYAVRESDIGDLPFSLPVVGEAAAGAPPGPGLPKRAAVRIFTGAPVPHGADRVIVQENTRRDGDTVTFIAPHGPGRHIRPAGSDFQEGDTLLPAGTRLDWRALTPAAAADRGALTVYRQPRVVILATGDELAAPGDAHGQAGAIPDSVSCAIEAFVADHGGVPVRCERLPDDLSVLAEAATRALADGDLVVMIGGASVGEHDHSRAAFGGALEVVFAKVAIKPGKPVWLARAGGKLVMGLPGNPSSALVTARLFLAPLLVGLGGGDGAAWLAMKPAVCGDPLPACGDRETFLRASQTDQGLVLAGSQLSGNQGALAVSDTLIRRAPGAPAAPAGAQVFCLDF